MFSAKEIAAQLKLISKTDHIKLTITLGNNQGHIYE